MFAKFSLLVCLALTVSATDNLQGFASDTEDFLMGIIKGLQPNPDMTSHCVTAGNNTVQWAWGAVETAVHCITFNFTACESLFTDFSDIDVLIANIETSCKFDELVDKFKDLETASGWSSLGFRFFLNE